MTSSALQPVSRAGALPDPGNGRLMSLDLLRGLAVAGMILVTNPGTYSAVYWPLLHAQWDGWTPTDMIFPAFLFAIGFAITLSFASRIERGYDRIRLIRHVLIRSLMLFFIGLVINGLPSFNLHTIRIPGILQRIALCYLCGSLLYLLVGRGVERTAETRQSHRITIIASIAIFLLAAYWALLKLVPVPGFGPGRLDSLGNLGAYLDRSIFGVSHLWAYGTTPGYGVTYDPEGLLSTIGALVTLLIGVLTGEWLRTRHSSSGQTNGQASSRAAFTLAGVGVALVLTGWLLNPLLPLNKRLWTSTFALFSGGVSLLVFSVLYWISDVKRWRSWAAPVLVFGTNALLAFILASVITTLTDIIHLSSQDGTTLTFHKWAYQFGFATWLQPIHASLTYAISIVLLNFALIYVLYRKRIFLRI